MFEANITGASTKLHELQYCFTSSISHTVGWKWPVKIAIVYSAAHNAEVRSSPVQLAAVAGALVTCDENSLDFGWWGWVGLVLPNISGSYFGGKLWLIVIVDWDA